MPNNSITHSMRKENARNQHMQPKGKPKRNKICDSTDRRKRREIEGKDMIQNPALQKISTCIRRWGSVEWCIIVSPVSNSSARVVDVGYFKVQ